MNSQPPTAPAVVTPEAPRGPVQRALDPIKRALARLRFDTPKRVSHVTKPENRPRSHRGGRRELRAELERRYVVLPSNAGTPDQFTRANIKAALAHGRAKLMASLAAAQTA